MSWGVAGVANIPENEILLPESENEKEREKENARVKGRR